MTKAATADKSPELPMEADVAPTRKRKSQEVAVAAAPAAAPAPADTMLASILAASLDPRVDTAKMGELTKLLNEERARQAEREAFSALIALQSARPRIAKDKASDKHKYATLEKVSSELDPLMAKHGFGLTTTMADSPLDGHYRVKGVLIHGHSGWSREYFLDFPAGAHKSPQGKELMAPSQGVGVILSYGRRYLKLMIFDVTIAGEDTDGERARDVTPITKKQLDELNKAIEFKGVDVPKLCTHFGVEAVDQLSGQQFAQAMNLIRQK
jgi:hypothetical protein